MQASTDSNTKPGKGTKEVNHLGPISRKDLSLFWGLNPTQSDSWLCLSLFVKLAPAVTGTA